MVKYNLVPRARFPFDQHQERGHRQKRRTLGSRVGQVPDAWTQDFMLYLERRQMNSAKKLKLKNLFVFWSVHNILAKNDVLFPNSARESAL